MTEDFGKIAVVAGILGILLLFGLFMHTTEPAAVDTTATTTVEQPATTTTIVSQQTLEMLEPTYSEKAVFQDDTIHIAFQASFTTNGVESRLPLWIHNLSSDVINILWDRCSIQLPSGNTVNVAHEGSADVVAPVGGTISIASAGDLFDAVIPVTEITWTDTGSQISTGVLDKGTFTLVLAIERAARPDLVSMRSGVAPQVGTSCPAEPPVPINQRIVASQKAGREIVYYTFRFVVR